MNCRHLRIYFEVLKVSFSKYSISQVMSVSKDIHCHDKNVFRVLRTTPDSDSESSLEHLIGSESPQKHKVNTKTQQVLNHYLKALSC